MEDVKVVVFVAASLSLLLRLFLLNLSKDVMVRYLVTTHWNIGVVMCLKYSLLIIFVVLVNEEEALLTWLGKD